LSNEHEPLIGRDVGARRGLVRGSAVKLDDMVDRRHAWRDCSATALIRFRRRAAKLVASTGLVRRRPNAAVLWAVHCNFRPR